jgi:gamma-glutamyltranspeptidase/glutathione hydrolase
LITAAGPALRWVPRALLPGLVLALAACGAPPRGTPPAPAPAEPSSASPPLPEIGTGLAPRPARDFARHAVAAAHPLAAEAGLAVLRQGGNALDAAIATAFTLGVVEPQSSGIGGGALLLHWDGRRLRAWDGREAAPAAAHERQFLGGDGRPLPLREAQRSGLAVGVPGAVAAWAAAHAQGGRLPWSQLLQPAIALAEAGAPIGPRLHRQLGETPTLRADAGAAALYFRADGTPRAVGERVANPALATVLRRIAAEGGGVMQGGAVAADLVRRVRARALPPAAPDRAGAPAVLAAADLAAYRALEREPLCMDWRERWRVCGFPPPSSGGLAVAQMLGLWAALPPAGDEAERLHRWAEVARLAFADRAAHVADPAFAAAPGGAWANLLQPAYLQGRASQLGPRSLGTAAPGLPLGAVMPAAAPMAQAEAPGTTHLSVADAEGGVVALTSSIEAQFGAQMVSDGGTGLPGGFLLNNQLTDFAFAPLDAQGRPVANRVQPGKRPRSSMSPTIVFDRQRGEPVLVLGSAQGPFIIPAVARVVVDTLERGQRLDDALAAPLVTSLNGPVTFVEAGRLDEAGLAALRARGHTVQTLPLASGLHVLQRVGTGWRAAADPRREGAVRGD